MWNSSIFDLIHNARHPKVVVWMFFHKLMRRVAYFLVILFSSNTIYSFASKNNAHNSNRSAYLYRQHRNGYDEYVGKAAIAFDKCRVNCQIGDFIPEENTTNTSIPLLTAVRSWNFFWSLIFLLVCANSSGHIKIMANLPPTPASLKPIAHFLKTAQEHGKWWEFTHWIHIMSINWLNIWWLTQMTSCVYVVVWLFCFFRFVYRLLC